MTAIVKFDKTCTFDKNFRDDRCISNFQEIILFCDACDKGYHMSCHNPVMMHKPKGI